MKQQIPFYTINPAKTPAVTVAHPEQIKSAHLTYEGVLVTQGHGKDAMYTYEDARAIGTATSTGEPYDLPLQPLLLQALENANINVEIVEGK